MRIGKHRVDLKKSSHNDATAHTPLTEGGHSHHLIVHAIIFIKSTSHCSFTHPTATTTCSASQPPPRRGRAVEVSNGLLNLLMSGGPSFTVAGRLSRPVAW